MSETKTCKDCKSRLPENDDNFYRHGDGYRFSPYCKPCHRKRTYASVQRQRERRREAGISVKATVGVLEETLAARESDGYLDRHLQRREQVAAIASTFERVEREFSADQRGMQLSSSPLNLNQIVSRIVFGRSPLKNFKKAWTANF